VSHLCQGGRELGDEQSRGGVDIKGEYIGNWALIAGKKADSPSEGGWMLEGLMMQRLDS